MKTCLLFTRTSEVAGAEKMVREIFNGVDKTEIAMKMAYLNKSSVLSALFGRYDIIHSHLFLPGLVIRIRRIFDSSFIWVHTVHYDSYKQQTWASLKKYLDENFIFPDADRLIAVSDAVANHLNKNTKLLSSVLTIHNCVRFLLNESNYKKNHKNEVLTLGAVSMLRSEKGLIELISAVAEMRKQGKQIRLKIAGEGPQRKILEKLILQKKLQNEVQLCGYISNLTEFYKTIDIFVSASHIESFGLALIEAMQFGLPIVASAVGQVPAVLQNGKFGVLVPRTENNFIENLVREIAIIAESLAQHGEASRQGYDYYYEKLNPKIFVHAHQALYKQLLRPGVCMVSPVITHATGGIQKQIKLQSKELNRLGYQVFMLQKNDPNFALKKDDWNHVTFLHTLTFKEHWFGKSRFFVRVSGIMFILFGVLKIRKHRRKISVIHAHQLFSSTTLGFLGKIFFKKILVVKVTASGQYGELNELKKLPFRSLRNISFRLIDKVIVLSDEMKSEMKTLGFSEDRIALIPNSVEILPDRLNFHPSEAKIFRILFTGRLSQEKSLETLIEAARQLATEGIQCEVILVGGASFGGRDSFEELQKIAAVSQVGLKICFVGAVSKINKFYEEADVFVLPSISEGMSNALLEAMAYGVACVASAIPANLFVVSPGHDALVFEPRNILDLAKQLRLLRPGTPEADLLRFQLGKNAQATVRRRFSIELIGSKLSNLYLEANRKNGSGRLDHD